MRFTYLLFIMRVLSTIPLLNKGYFVMTKSQVKESTSTVSFYQTCKADGNSVLLFSISVFPRSFDCEFNSDAFEKRRKFFRNVNRFLVCFGFNACLGLESDDFKVEWEIEISKLFCKDRNTLTKREPAHISLDEAIMQDVLKEFVHYYQGVGEE